MAAELVLTEGMIDCFHSCAKKADYRQLFNDYSRFFDDLVENLEKTTILYFLKNDACGTIGMNTKYLLNVLKEWPSGGPLSCKEIIAMEKKLPNFIGHFRKSCSIKNWNEFYTEYKPTIDEMITLARLLKAVDIKIECKGILFDSFGRRDEFLEYSQKFRNELMSQTRDELKLREEDAKELRNELFKTIAELKKSGEAQTLIINLMDRFASQAQHMEHGISEAYEWMSQIRENLKLSEEIREEDRQKLRNELTQIREELEMKGAKLEEDGQKLRNELMLKINDERMVSELNRIEDGHKLRIEMMSRINEELELSEQNHEENVRELRINLTDRFEKQAQEVEHQVIEADEKMFQIREELQLSERKHEENGQELRNELWKISDERILSEQKREEDGHKLRNELMETIANQAQQTENRISETNEKMSHMREELQLSEERREEEGQKLRNELMERFESQAQQMENRISETNEKIEFMNRKLAHFNSSINEKFNSLEEKISSIQLDKKMEALSIQKNGAEDLNQFLDKIGDKFNEQQAKMESRADWLDRKMEMMMEMMKQQGEKSSGDEK